MRYLILILMFAGGLPATAMAQEVVGEWSNESGNCDEMRVIYEENGDHPTVVNANGEWVEVSENTWERDGDVVYVSTDTRTDAWDIVELTDEYLHMVNQDPEAEEYGVGETELYRCPPR